MATLTVYPDPHTEVTSVDGSVRGGTGNNPESTWAELLASPGTGHTDSSSTLVLTYFNADVDTDRWGYLYRGILLFDTSALPDNCVITSAVLSVCIKQKGDTLGASPDLNAYSSAPASNVDIVNGDFDSLGSEAFCDTPVAYADCVVDAFIDFTLNTAGIAAISKTGITKLGIRNASYDVAEVSPTWASGSNSSFIYAYAADQADTDKDPKLVITYTAVPIVTTQAITLIKIASATGNGDIEDLGTPDPTAHGVCWNTTGTPTTSDDYTDEGAVTATGTFTSEITELSAHTAYYARAYATNSAGTAYGNEVEFSTIGGEGSGVIGVVEERLHYADAYGVQRYILGTVVP